MSKNILLVSYYCPSRGHAGGLRLLDLYMQIKQIDPTIKLTLLSCRDEGVDWGYDHLKDLFDDIHWVAPQFFKRDFILAHEVFNQQFDVIDCQFHRAGALVNPLKKRFVNTHIVYSIMESQVRVALLSFKSLGRFRPRALLSMWFSGLKEIIYCWHASRVSCVSYADLQILKCFVPAKKLLCIETGISPSEFSGMHKIADANDNIINIEKNKEIIFLAYFSSKTNRDALSWFCKFVHPLIRDKVPDYQFRVVGRGLDDELTSSCHADGVCFVGEVDDLLPEINRALIGISPALHGAGVRGKIHQYAVMGVACVASPLSVVSLKYTHGKDIFLAETAGDFAHYCTKLLTDATLAQTMGQAARLMCLSNYTWAAMVPKISELYLIA